MTNLPPPPSQWTPGPAYGHAPRPYMASTGLVTALSILLPLTILATLGSAYAQLHRASLVDDCINSTCPPFNELKDSDDLVAATSVLTLLGLLVCGVLWIIWQYRYVSNARGLGRVGLGPGWAIGGWFVPCGNFGIIPAQLWQAGEASDPARLGGRPSNARPLIVLWAVLWIGASILSFSDGQLTMGDDGTGVFQSPQDLRDSDQSGGYAMLAYAAAGVIAVLMIRWLSEGQREAFSIRGPVAAAGLGPYAQSAGPYAAPAPPPQPGGPFDIHAPSWAPKPEGWQPAPPAAPPPPPPPAPPG